MELRQLDKSVLKLWYIRAIIVSFILISIWGSTIAIATAAGATYHVLVAVCLGSGIPMILLLGVTLIMPTLRYRMYAWGYDDKKIIVKQGVVFRKRVVIPICQIQDLHRTQGPLMLLLKLSGVTISTAGSNFALSTLTTIEADRMIDELEQNFEKRIEEQKNEEI